MAKSKTYSIYLVKSDVGNFEHVFTQNAQDRIKAGDFVKVDSDELGTVASLYLFNNAPTPPSWLSDVSTVFQNVPALRNQSSSAVVIFKHVDRIFATAFAHGWQFIDDTKIEMDFGLRVAINSLGDDKVSRIDSSHLGEAMKGVAQSVFQRDLREFGIDEALDLVRRISGRIEGDDFAKNIAGATSLKITKEMKFSELAEVAKEALTRSESEEYKKTAFYMIDKVRPISDKIATTQLDELAVKNIKEGTDCFELSMPGWAEDDVVYYGMKGPGVSKRYPDLLLENYRSALGDKLIDLDVASIIKKHAVFAEFNNDASSKKQWSIKKALIGSISLDTGLYAISEGEWYRLDTQFKSDVDAGFEDLKEDWGDPPEPIIQKISTDGKKTAYESELDYNKRCANKYGQVCLDQKILTVPTVPYGKFEACDLLDIDNKRLIHVKKSSRQSSVLSHFFKQGSNSARVLKTFPEARNVMIEKVRTLTDGPTAEKLKTALGDSLAGWKVEYHIVDAPRKDGTFKIPFFSRITLREESRTLRGMTYKVALRFISAPTTM